jgi:hypothetical protein
MEEREIQIAMKRIKKIEDEAKRRLLNEKEKKVITRKQTKKMGTITSKINSKETFVPKLKPKLYCKIITQKGVQCSKYQNEGYNNMCKQHYDNLRIKASEDVVMKTPSVPKVSKKSEDPKPMSSKKSELKNSDFFKPSYPSFTIYQKAVPMDIDEEPKPKKSKKKEPIPAAIKTLVWNKWVGEKVAETKCICCRVSSISMRHFVAGHIVSEKHGGKCTIDNLRPICQPCNLSMGTSNMNEFIEKFGLHR